MTMTWNLPANTHELRPSSHEYKVLPYSRKATVNLGSHYSVFVLTLGRCICGLSKAWHEKEITYPQPDMDVRVYSDSEHDSYDPKNKSLRDKWFAEFWPTVKRNNKAQVIIYLFFYLLIIIFPSIFYTLCAF
jgi:hypothetical protein